MTTDSENQLAVDARERKNSVTRNDIAEGNVRWVFPTFGLWTNIARPAALPEQLPGYNRYSFFSYRDIVQLSTPHYEGMWADAINIAVTKVAGWDWEAESSIPLRRKRLQNIMLHSTAGVFNGYVPFISAHLRGYALTGKGIVEIERETSSYSSRIKALHHLNPLRCQITDDPKVPVLYYDRQGKVHELKYHEVMLFGDQFDPTLGEMGMVESAADRAYSRITLLSAISQYLYEKVTGKRPLELNFIQGITSSNLTDAVASADHDREAKGAQLYMGVAAQAIPGDVPIQKVSIPLAGLPDNFEPQELRDDAYIIYANALGLDVNDIDPRLAVRTNLGSGAQAFILDQKSKGRGFISWKKQFLHNLNLWVADTATKFTFSEQTPDDELKKEQISAARIQNVNAMIDKGIITADQGRNILVDNGDLPREFLQEDITGGGSLGDDDKPIEGNSDDEDTRPQPQQTAVPPQQQPQQETQKSIDLASGANAALLRAQIAMNANTAFMWADQNGAEVDYYQSLQSSSVKEQMEPVPTVPATPTVPTIDDEAATAVSRALSVLAETV